MPYLTRRELMRDLQDGIVLGADTRATAGPIVADKNCEKVRTRHAPPPAPFMNFGLPFAVAHRIRNKLPFRTSIEEHLDETAKLPLFIPLLCRR